MAFSGMNYLAVPIAAVVSFASGAVWYGGLTTAFFLWLGFVATSMCVNHRFQGRGWNLTVIDGDYWLVAMLLQGAIIGAMGV